MDHGDQTQQRQPSTTPCEPEKIPERPRAPNPSSDPGVVPEIVPATFNDAGTIPSLKDFDVSCMSPLLAVKILAQGVKGLSDLTGDIPPTPAMELPREAALEQLRTPQRGKLHKRTASAVPSHDMQAPDFRKVDVGSPEAHNHEPDVGHGLPERQVSELIARKFFSKKTPPISIDDYLLRLHRYCPMSTAVYLAAAVYIYRLAVTERLVPVTARTVHRLLLAALRCAMKALEDLNYPPKRFAGVGGVSEKELAKLEISFLYLIDFELRVDNVLLQDRAWALLQLSPTNAPAPFPLLLPTRPRRTTVT